jgi:hypothetical protein
MEVRQISLKPTKQFRPGRSVLDCSGPIHRSWIERMAKDDHLKVLVYRRDFRAEEIDLLPRLEGVQMVSGDLTDVLKRAKESVSLLIDDLGAFHFHEQPLELLKRYYEALAWDGEAWIRFPKSFWVFLEDDHRVSLQDYVTQKFPRLARAIRPAELDPMLAETASSSEGWILLKKDRLYPKLFFALETRTLGGTSCPAGSPHAPYLEFVERAAGAKAGAFKRVA